MAEPDDRVEVELPPAQLVAGDLLVIDTVEHHVDGVRLRPEVVDALVPDPLPIPREVLVRVRRRRADLPGADALDRARALLEETAPDGIDTAPEPVPAPVLGDARPAAGRAAAPAVPAEPAVRPGAAKGRR